MRNLTKVMLFISSYAPLSVILCILSLQNSWRMAVALLSVGVIGILWLVIFLRVQQSKQPFMGLIAQAQQRDGEIMGYIATYIVPFVTLPFDNWYRASAFLVLLVTIGFLYVNSNMLYVNPALMLLGFHLYAITLDNSQAPYLCLTRRPVKKGDYLPLLLVHKGILIEKQAGRKRRHDATTSIPGA
jgi:hypothetical protein